VSEFNRLLSIMDDLREKCPWDRKQTFESLSHLTIEEVYELYDAIQNGDIENIKEEVADIMLHLVFYVKLINEKEGVTIDDILKKGNDKLVSRHPQEGKNSILGGVPKSLPSVVKAYRLQDKAAQVGFQWDHIKEVQDKLAEEIIELNEAIDSNSLDKIEDELGDVLFSIINLSRYLKVDPEMALQRTNQKFIQRFQYIENNSDKPLADMSLEEMDLLWNLAKTV
jgi:XTP/dITP diphosphohydrolase